LHALLSRSGCQATTSRTPPHGMQPPLHAQVLAWGPLAAVRLHRSSRTPTPAAVRWRQRSRQRGRTPTASRRLPGQQQWQAPPAATRPPSFGIQAEAGVPLSVPQLSRPAGRLDVVYFPPRSSAPTVAGCRVGGYPVGCDWWGGKSAAGGMSKDNDRCFSTLVLGAFSTGVFQHHLRYPALTLVPT
jgi:hypothetical protein